MTPAARGAGLVVWLAAAPAVAHAQRVTGMVYDSLLADAALPNATLWVEGAGAQAFTDGSLLMIDLANGDPIPVPASDVAGIEVYSGPGTVPTEYQQGSGCGVVAIWTKRGAVGGDND
jgi:hypothetical protein